MYVETIKSKTVKKYRTSITINGKKYNSPTFIRKTDCKEWFFKKQNERAELSLHGDSNKLYECLTINDYSAKWLETKSSQGASRATLKNYECYIRIHIVPHFNGMNLRSIQKSHIESFQSNLRKSHNPKGVNLIIGALKGLFREAIREGYLLKSPCEFIKTLSSDTAYDIYWTEDEINQFLKANHNNDLYELFLVALNTGMRKGELAGLCWDRVNFQYDTITVTRTRDKFELKERTKTTLKRVIPMNAITRATLFRLFELRTSGENLVFLKKNVQPISPHHIYRQFHAAQELAGLKNPIKFHSTRHTFASQFVNRGGSIYDLQKILGHTNVVMTMRYAHLSMDHLHSAMKTFSLGESRPNDEQSKQVQQIVFLKRAKEKIESPKIHPELKNQA